MRTRQLFIVLASALLAACDGGGGGGSTGPTSPPASMQIVAGNQQNAAVNTQLPQELVVRVLDAQGAPVRNATVLWQLTHGSGTLTPITTITDASGEARASYKLGTVVGSETITAVVGGLSATFQENLGLGPITAAIVTPAPDTIPVGGVVLLTALAADAFGNTINTNTVQWSTSNGGVAAVQSVVIDGHPMGRVTGTALGTATITATLENGATGTAQVVVAARAPSATTLAFQTVLAQAGQVQLDGQVIGNGLSTTTWFEWGTDPTLATFQQTPQPPRLVPTVNQPYLMQQVISPTTPGVTYYYRVVAQNSLGTTKGNIRSFNVPVAAILNLQATVVPDSFMVRLRWQVNAETHRTVVERRMFPDRDTLWQLIADTAYITSAGYEFLDITVPADTIHTVQYRVSACSYPHACFAAAPVQVSTPALQGPVGLTAVADAAHHVVVSWQDLEPHETGWSIRREQPGKSRPDFGAQLPPNTTSYADATTQPGVTYVYTVMSDFVLTIPDPKFGGLVSSGRSSKPVSVTITP